MDRKRIWMDPRFDTPAFRRFVREQEPDAEIMGCGFRERKRPRPKTELTPIGEQYVIPGCEKHARPKGAQLKLWEG